MEATSYINLNLTQPAIACVVYAKQGDEASRHIRAQLSEGSTPWTPPAGSSAIIRYAKPDGTVGFYDTLEDEVTAAVSIVGSVANITLAAQALTVAGTVVMELNFYTQDAKLTTFRWLVEVEASVVTDGQIESSDYYSVLSQLIEGLLGATTHPPQIDATTKNWLLWDEDTAQYVDSGYSSIGTTGPAPTLQSTTLAYVLSDSGTTIPSSGWSSSIPTLTPGKFLWTRTTSVFSTGTVVSYSVAWQGVNGQGAVNSVNGESPDGSGNVALSASDIPTSDSSDVQAKLTALATPLRYTQASYTLDANGNAVTALANNDCKIVSAVCGGSIVEPWVSGVDGFWHIRVISIAGEPASGTKTVLLVYAPNGAIASA